MANMVVQNTDKAYGYNYTSLAALALAGVDIPRMRTATYDGRQYVEYLDDSGEWQRGAEVVVPDMKGMNAAQAYGSALTYARRYTVMMARSVACTDDQLLETQAPKRGNSEAPEKTAPRREARKTVKTEAIAPENRVEANSPDGVNVMICEDCGEPITPQGRFGVMEIASRSFATYGKNLCWTCAGKAKAAKEAAREAVKDAVKEAAKEAAKEAEQDAE